MEGTASICHKRQGAAWDARSRARGAGPSAARGSPWCAAAPPTASAAHRKALAADPKYAAAWDNPGNLLATKLDRPAEAEEAFRKAIKADPGYAPAHHSLGVLLQTDRAGRVWVADFFAHTLLAFDGAGLRQAVIGTAGVAGAGRGAIGARGRCAGPGNDSGYLPPDFFHGGREYC